MAFSFEEKTGNGSTHTYTFTFNYILKDHVKLFYTRDILANTQASTLVSGTDYNWTADKSIQLIGSTLNSGTTTGQPYNLPNGTKLMIERQTPDSSQISTWQDGSNLTAEALNNADLQNLYVVQETQDRQDLSATKAIASETASTTATNDVAVLTANYFKRDGTLPMTGPLQLGTNKLTGVGDPTAAQDAVTKAYLERSGSIASAQIVDGTIVDGDVNASAAISGSKLQASSGSNAGSMSSAHYSKLEGIEASATADQSATEIKSSYESNSDTNAYTDAEKTKLSGIETSATADQSASEIKSSYESNSNTNAFTDANKTLVDAISATATEINYTTNVTSDIQSQINNKQPLDSELTTLAGMQAATASKLAAGTNLTSDIADLNQIDGLTKQTTISDSDASFPTSGAVVDYVAAQISPLGGLEVVATEVAFPNTQPASGVVISISDAGGVVINGSGVSTTGRTVGGATITINGFPSSLQGETLVAGVGLMVSSTGSSQTYNYHKILGKEDDIKQLSDDINDFNERYRVENTLPAANSSTNHDGDLVWAKDVGKMYVYSGDYNGSPVGSFGEVQSIGNFYISTLSPAFNGSLQDFTITNAPSSAEQILLSINGVLQRPNAGSSVPSEGFALSGSTVKLGAAPASTDTYFAVVIGSTVNIGTPSNNTVNNAILQSGCVDNAKVATNAAIVGSKLADDSIAEVKLDVHNAPSGTDKFLAYTSNGMEWAVPTDTNTQLSFANDANNRVITGTGSGGLNGEANLTFDGSNLNIVDGGAIIGGGSDNDVLVRLDHEDNTGKAEIQLNAWGSSSISLISNFSGSTYQGVENGSFGLSSAHARDINFVTAGSERLRIRSGGDVQVMTKLGIGITPNRLLTLYGDTGLALQNSTTGTGNSNGTHIWVNDQNNGELLIQNKEASDIEFYTSDTERLRIDSSGMSKFTRGSGGTVGHFYANARESNILIQNDARTWKIVNYDYGNNGTDHLGFHDGTTDRVIIQNTGGISFNGDTAAANALDDYEEGTWTPLLESTGTAFTSNTNWSSDSRYTKIGRMVTIQCYQRSGGIDKGSAASTDGIAITGLPFTPTNVVQRSMVPIGQNVNWAGNPNQALVRENIANVELYKYASSGSNNTGIPLTVADVGTAANNNYAIFTLTYESA